MNISAKNKKRIELQFRVFQQDQELREEEGYDEFDADMRREDGISDCAFKLGLHENTVERYWQQLEEMYGA